MTIYACISGGFVVAQLDVAGPADGVGPPLPSGVDVGDFDQVAIIPAKIARPAGISDSMRLHWNDGNPEFRETATLAELITIALDKPRADINAVVWDAVGNLTEEYKDAEADARTYKAAAYAGTVPPSVDCFAQHNPTGSVQTGQWAADDIIMRADAFSSAKLAMREKRFASQSAMRAATTPAELSAAVAGWDSFIAQLRAQLGL